MPNVNQAINVNVKKATEAFSSPADHVICITLLNSPYPITVTQLLI